MKLAQANQTAVALKDDFERLFDRFFRMTPFPAPTRDGGLMWSPKLDFSETEKEFVVRIEAPGVAKDDLDVALDGQMLTVVGRRELARQEENEEFFWREREEGRFVRSVQLPEPVAPETVDARYSDGMLTIRLVKAQPSPRSRIAIK